MPFHDAAPRRGNLTKPERQQALAVIYGIPDRLTEAEADEIRAKLSADDPNKTE